jgi:hypothetical protein
MALPEVLRFEDLGEPGERVIGGPRCFYAKGEFRAPKKGEWYASGAEPMAYKAKNDLSSAYQIVVPTRYAKPATGFVPGAPVRL